VLVLLFSGLVHGVWTDRWSDGTDLKTAVAQLEQLPRTLGGWEGEPLPGNGNASGGLAGSLSRRYVHRGTGKAVTIFLGCGRAGPASIHTPDVCYAASGFKEEDAHTEFTLPADSAAAGGVFYTAQFVKNRAAEKTQLRIFWSWFAEGKWQVSANPRFAFVRQPVLYKLYLIREVPTGPISEPPDAEPCVELMNLLLPALERTVFRKA
jgi:hypothetical protein